MQGVTEIEICSSIYRSFLCFIDFVVALINFRSQTGTLANACFLALYACCYLLVLVLAGWFDPGFDGGGDWFWFGDRFASLGIAVTLNMQFLCLTTIK